MLATASALAFDSAMSDMQGAHVLVLGGTVFVGRAFVEHALAQGADVTTFNRGQSGPDVVGVRAIRGDRTDPDALADLARGHYDFVVDTTPQVPAHVVMSTRVLADAAHAYVVVSTIGSVQGWGTDPITIDTPLLEHDPDAIDNPDYSSAKAGVEAAALRELGERAVIVRPGVIAGPYERIGRLPWWLTYVKDHDLIIAPGRPTANYQVVDVRDLAAVLAIAGMRTSRGDNPGIIHAINPPGRDTIEDLVSACVDAVGGRHELVWVGDDDVLAAGVEPWDGFPQWLPDTAEWTHALNVDDSSFSSLVQGRPLEETVLDTWQWMQTGGEWNRPESRLSAAQYAQLHGTLESREWDGDDD